MKNEFPNLIERAALVVGYSPRGAFRGSMQHEAKMEVSWCDDVARV